MNLKEFLREVRQTHDANIANTYVAKEDVDFTATDLADVFANAGASSATQPSSNKLTPTLTINEESFSHFSDSYWHLYYHYNGDGQVFAHCNAAFTFVNSGELAGELVLYFEPDPYFAEEVSADNPVVVTLHATEGDNYAAATTTVTLGNYNPE